MMPAMRSGMVVLMLAANITASDHESHIAIPPSASDLTPAQILEQKLTDPKANQVLRDLMRAMNVGNLAVDSNLRELLMKDPAAANVLRRLRDGDPQLLKLVEQIAASHPELRGLGANELRNQASELARRYTAGTSGLRRTPGDSPSMMRPPISLEERERAAQQKFNEQINDLLRDLKLDGITEQLRDTPAFRELLQDLGKSSLGSMHLPSGWNPKMLDFKSIGSWLNNLRMRLPKNLPSLRGPSISPHIPGISFGRPSLPGGFSTPSFGEGWSAIVCVFMVGLALALLWKVIRWTPAARLSEKHRRLSLHLDHVNSWPELIRAFEGVAMNRFGPDAVHWNHRQIVQNFGDVGEQTDVVALASLYESARYAPTLSKEPDWFVVRGSLRRIAGASA